MKNKRTTKYLMLLSALALTTGLQAQTSLNVKKRDGSQTTTTLSSVRKITFPTTGKVEVLKKDGTSQTLALSDARYFSFNVSATEVPLVPTSDVQVYPCPASSELMVDFEATNGENAIVSISNIQGQTIQKQGVKTVDGKNSIKFDVSTLALGIYLLSIETGTTMETKKLIISNN